MGLFLWHRIRIVLLAAAVFALATRVPAAVGVAADLESVGSETGSPAIEPLAQWIHRHLPEMENDWGGHLKILYQHAQHGADSLFSLHEAGGYDDGQFYLRLKDRVLAGAWEFDVHYEFVNAGGDTQRALSRIGPAAGAWIQTAAGETDERRLMDLSHTFHDAEEAYGYHRLDRLMLAYHGGWGDLRVGRQAQTWGNGFLFNPMDLFNPFAPTDIARDYKTGDDMVHLQLHRCLGGETQFVYVPRRQADSGDLQWNESSLAGMVHWRLENFEVETMLARHYRDLVAGFGLTGYLGAALWRTDVVWTHGRSGYGSQDDLSWVANLDYSWAWFGKNIYGLVELYYNGAGKTDPVDAVFDPVLLQRITRREMFVTGREYLGLRLDTEIHPLVHLPFSLIVNLRDPSAVLQPSLVWDARRNVQVVLSAAFFMGDDGSEFGGVAIPGTTVAIRPADTLTGWVSFYF